MKKVLFVGESWSATLMEVKGFNSFLSSKYEENSFKSLRYASLVLQLSFFSI